MAKYIVKITEDVTGMKIHLPKGIVLKYGLSGGKYLVLDDYDPSIIMVSILKEERLKDGRDRKS